MDTSSGRGRGQHPSTSVGESLALFSEAVHIVLLRWTALRLAVHNEWGGIDSRQKSDQLAQDIVSWFASSKAPLHVDELEMMLDERMVLSFSAQIEDGSIEEVAEQLMIIHEDCLEGNYEIVFHLRNSSKEFYQAPQRKEKEDEGSDEEYQPASDMALDVIM